MADESTEAPTATAEVLDPKNAPVPSTVTVDRVAARVTFTPSMVGAFHVTVRFSPGDALAQIDAEVARDTSRSYTELPAECGAVLERVGSSTILCGQAVFRDGVKLTDLGEGTVATANDGVLWTISSGTVRRFIDTGAGPLQRSPEAGAAEPDPVRAWSATASDLWVIDSQLTHYVAEKTGIVRVGSAALPDPSTVIFGINTSTVLLVHGAHLRVLISDPVDEAVAACPFETDRSGVPQPSGKCERLEGIAEGTEQDRLWTFRDESSAYGTGDGTLTLFGLGDSGVSRLAQVHIVAPIKLASVVNITNDFGRPVFYVGDPVFGAYDGGTGTSPTPLIIPREDHGDILFDYVASYGIGDPHARGDAAWLVTEPAPNSVTRIVTRPP